jgi:hypothetical protein
MVRKGGLEPPQGEPHKILKQALLIDAAAEEVIA